VTTLLAIETSSTVGSLAVLRDGTVRERFIATPRAQTEQLLPLIEELLTEADSTVAALDAIVFGRGPGSFTGLRIAAAVAQGLALAARKPVLAVSSLAAVAQHAWEAASVERSLVCIDARMGEVYFGCYELHDGVARAHGPEQVGAPETMGVPEWRHWTALGAGFTVYAEALAHVARRAAAVMPDLEPRARDLLPIAAADWAAGRAVPAAAALPTYLRDASAWKRSRP
jgi:tRNA threonylcarbamoyladenosine biosynthesis protein TsaB